jgi:hypothetical protein
MTPKHVLISTVVSLKSPSSLTTFSLPPPLPPLPTPHFYRPASFPSKPGMMWTCLSRAYERYLRPKESQDSFPTQQLFVLGKQPLIIAIASTLLCTDGLNSQHYAGYANLLRLCPYSLMLTA